MLATVSSAASLRALAAYHAELGPMDATGNDDVTAAWERLRDGTLADMTAP